MRFKIRSAAATLLLPAAAWLAGCGTPPEPSVPPEPDWSLSTDQSDFAEALTRYSMGISSEAQRDLDTALTNYVSAAQLDPDNEDLHYQVAMALIQRKRYDEALTLIDNLSQRKPRSERALLWLALIYRATDQTDQALHTYERAMKLAPTSSVAYIEAASMYSKLGRDDDAIKLLERGVSKVDKPADLLRVLAGIYLRGSKEADKPYPEAQLKKAIALIEKALENEPDDEALLYQLGDLYILNHQVEKAIEAFERIEKQNPDDMSIKQKLAMSFVAVGDKDNAIQTLESLSEKQPENPRILFYLAELYEQAEDLPRAMDAYERITRLSTPDPSAFLKLSLLQAKQSPRLAVETLERGQKELPDDARLSEMLAYMYLSEGEYQKAMEPFAEAARLMEKSRGKPFVESFYLKYAIASQLAGGTNDAAALLYKAMDVNPAYLDAYMQYIFQATDPTNIAQSVAMLNEIAERKPDDPSLYLYLGLLNSYAKAYPAALAAFEKAEQLSLDSADRDEILTPLFYFWYAAACERSEKFDRAEQLFLKCLELDPEHAEAYNYLAYMWAEKGMKLEQAREMVLKALKLDPTSGAYIDTLGWIAYMQGQYDEALKAIGKASEILPDDPTIAEHLGDVYDKLGKPEQALEHWKQAYALDPSNEKLGKKLQDLGVDLAPLVEHGKELQKLREKEEEQDLILQGGTPPGSEEPDEEAQPDAAPATNVAPESVPVE
jgi:tetratricopeptide (TPR) repeat protein